MTIEKLQRSVWRLRRGNLERKTFRKVEVEEAVMLEFNTTRRRTVIEKIKAMVRLGWIDRNKKRFILTDKGIKNDFKVLLGEGLDKHEPTLQQELEKKPKEVWGKIEVKVTKHNDNDEFSYFGM